MTDKTENKVLQDEIPDSLEDVSLVPLVDDEKLIVPYDQITALSRYRTAQEVRILAERVEFLSKGNPNPPTLNECIAIAAYALYYGLDPGTNELHHWIQMKGKVRQLTIYRGRDGTESLATRAAKQAGSHLYPPRYFEVDVERKKALGIPVDALAIDALVSDYKSYGEYIDRGLKWKEMGFSPDKIEKLLGPEPSYSGIGVVTAPEMERRNNPSWLHKCQNAEENKIALKRTGASGNPYTLKLRRLTGFDDCPDCGHNSKAEPSKWNNAELCRKRAYVAAIQKWAARYDPSDLVGARHEAAAFAIAGEWRDVTDDPDSQPDPPSGVEPSDDGIITIDTTPSDVTPPDPKSASLDQSPAPSKPKEVRVPRTAAQTKEAYLKLVVKHKGSRTHESLTDNAGWMLSECFPGDDDARHGCQMYLAGKPSLTDFTGAELKALLEILNASRGEDGKHHPDPTAAQEMRACAMSLKAEGAK